jgi:alginate O-acetyltransferase complex protein AlgI
MWYLNMSAVLALIGMAVVMGLTRWVPQQKRVLLLAFNLLFIGVYSQRLLAFYIVYTVVNYLLFVFLARTAVWRRFWFIAFLALNIGGVVILRLSDMKILEHPVFGMIVTIGIIYNVLKAIDALYFAYFIGKDAICKPIDYANYLLFVPTFTSGPILKFRDFMADVKVPYKVDAKLAEASVKRIILGMFKKIVLVAWMTSVFDRVSAGDLTTVHSLFLMVWFYALIYFDFSGYSDIAVGFGRLMGYQIPENFKRPFMSPTLTQYWRNWHATLGDWFRDHIYMFFSRKSPSKWTGAGLSVLIMVLIGLWHGFTWLYVAWGVYHGVLIAAESLMKKSLVNRKKVSAAYFYGRCLLTQAIVTLAVIVYCPNHEIVYKIYRGLLHFPSFG